MKRISIYLLSLILSGAFFTACENDESDPKLTLDKNSIDLFIGEETVVKVSGGETPYKATPADETVAGATVGGSDITIKGLKVGNTTVKVIDKNGLEAIIAVAVKEDPYEAEKEDATVRVSWGEAFEKVQGIDAGLYELSKTEDKTVTFTWTNEAEEEAEEESFVLTFQDTNDKIGGESETASTLESPAVAGKLTVTVDGESTDYNVTSWRLVQAEPADDEEGTPDTYWIAFAADGKSGLCVAPLTAETE
ncbi:hypothetical protein [uncultured Proteiniphilum sp.]|uniref:hypothetical protein n=1 Tax=uncultured Proteiniphilum sp. TaxID=497637 RepID=UPI002619CDE5|nr:hypothetical protein [uncultured Proteiniphilum sp.]